MNLGFALAATALWILILLIKVEFEPAHYQTVDGTYYQQLAQSFLNGEPMVLKGLANAKGNSFSPYPPGFPFLLALVHHFTGFSFTISAVLLHGLFLFGMLILFQNSALGSLLIVAAFSDTGMELGANCWSEFSFFALILTFGHFFLQSQSDTKRPDGFLLGILVMISFLIRYSAVFLAPFLVWKIVDSGNQKLRNQRVITLILFGLFFAGWTWWQLFLTGLPTGGDRYPNSDSVLSLILDFILETGNQLALFKNPFKSNFYGFLFAGIGQIILTIWMYKLSKTKSSENSDFGLVFCQLGLFYLLFIIPVRMHYYFAESFDCRLLGPGFLLLIPGLASRFSAFQSGFRPGKWLAIYMIISSLFFLPKNEILNFIQNSTFRN